MTPQFPPLFALPVEVRRCARNPKRIVVVAANGETLLRTLDDGPREQDIAERFARAMNEWAAADARRVEMFRYGTSRLKDEASA